MRVRWFGEPWGQGGRATICEDDTYKIKVPVGAKCIECTQPFKKTDRGVVTGCSTGIWGHWFLEIEADPEYEIPAGTYAVCGYHLKCWLEVVFGGVLSERVLARMNYKVEDDDPVVRDVSDDANVTPGRGWRKGAEETDEIDGERGEFGSLPE